MGVGEAMQIKNCGKMKKLRMNGKKNNLIEIKNRLKGWQLESFIESYDHKVKSGISLFKKQNLK